MCNVVNKYISACERIPIKMERIKLALDIPEFVTSLTINVEDFIELAGLCGFSLQEYKEFANKYKLDLTIQTGPGARERGVPTIEGRDLNIAFKFIP